MDPFDMSSCNCIAMRKAARRISNLYDEKLATTGLRVTQLHMLTVINRAGEISVNALAEQLDLDRTTTGKNMQPLERAGLLSISASRTDARQRSIKLTRSGSEKFHEAWRIWKSAQADWEQNNHGVNAADLRATLDGLKTG